MRRGRIVEAGHLDRDAVHDHTGGPPPTTMAVYPLGKEHHAMAAVRAYRATADAQIAATIAGAASPFAIDVRFLGGLTQKQEDAFKAAANRWTRLIVGDLPSVLVDGEAIDDVLILAQGTPIDGPGASWGRRVPPTCGRRPPAPPRSSRRRA